MRREVDWCTSYFFGPIFAAHFVVTGRRAPAGDVDQMSPTASRTRGGLARAEGLQRRRHADGARIPPRKAAECPGGVPR